MTLTLDEDEILSAAIAGVPRVAELIATVRAEHRSRALEAAEKSYLETAHTLGYQDTDAQKWASAVMSRLRIEEDSYKLRMLTSHADIAKLTDLPLGLAGLSTAQPNIQTR